MSCLILSRLRKIAGRCRRGNDTLRAIQAQLTRMEHTMPENTSTLLAKLADLEAKADAYTTQQGKRLADAVAAARKAQQAEDQESAKAEMAAALAKINEIGKGLVTFSPSGN
jgi:DNA uptake protein ComE-like DNA-binding protein